MKILDKYILKKYITTFILTLSILLPIGIAIDISEKVHKFLEQPDLGVSEIISDHYIPFIINYGNTYMPLGLFIATILFTSKLASNTEIIPIHSAGISYNKFLKPYLIGAIILTAISLWANHFIVPGSSQKGEEFFQKYLTKSPVVKSHVRNISLQLSESDNVYFRSFNLNTNTGFDFSYESYDGLQLKYKLIGKSIKWNKKDSIYTITSYTKRNILAQKDAISSGRKMDTIFNFQPKDLLYIDYLAKGMPSPELYKHIKKSEKRGVKNLNKYKVELYRRTSLPLSSFVLTFIAVALASKKRRGGIGISLAIGIGLMFMYVFFMKVAEVLGSGAAYNPLFMVWLPNVLFGILALFLYVKAKQ